MNNKGAEVKEIQLDSVFWEYVDQGMPNDEALAEMENDLVCSGFTREKAKEIIEDFKKEFEQ
jgi:hypothetical protein